MDDSTVSKGLAALSVVALLSAIKSDGVRCARATGAKAVVETARMANKVIMKTDLIVMMDDRIADSSAKRSETKKMTVGWRRKKNLGNFNLALLLVSIDASAHGEERWAMGCCLVQVSQQASRRQCSQKASCCALALPPQRVTSKAVPASSGGSCEGGAGR